MCEWGACIEDVKWRSVLSETCIRDMHPQSLSRDPNNHREWFTFIRHSLVQAPTYWPNQTRCIGTHTSHTAHTSHTPHTPHTHLTHTSHTSHIHTHHTHLTHHTHTSHTPHTPHTHLTHLTHTSHTSLYPTKLPSGLRRLKFTMAP